IPFSVSIETQRNMAKGKSKTFGEMVGASILDDMRKSVQDYRSDLESKYSAAKATVDTLTTELDQVNISFEEMTASEYLQHIKARIDLYNKYQLQLDSVQDKRNKALELLNDWKRFELNSESVQSMLDSIDQYKENLTKLEYSDKNYDQLLAKLEKQKGKLPSLIENTALLREKRNELVNRIRDLDELTKDNGVCPTCGSKTVSGDSFKKIKLELISKKQELVHFDFEYNEAEKQLKFTNTMKDNIQTAIHDMQKLKDRITVYKNMIIDAEKSVTRLNIQKPKYPKPDIKVHNQALELASSTCVKVRDEILRGKELLKSYKRLSERLKLSKLDLLKVEKVYSIYNWLFVNIPIMKLRYIDENKVLVERLINEELTNMGIPFSVSIETQRNMAKGKSIKDEFQFNVMNNRKNSKAHKDDLSGGEETCILLATQFAINAVMRNNIGFEIYDEIYGALDAKNKAIVIESIKGRKGKQILSVSHDQEISNSFDRNIRIEQVEGNSKVKEIV
ncbi:hypothetical protein MEO43_25395, partial [Dolichospermum sp. ST_sed5]|nr:hypothetical protein [Dolichospermum sp. ST_sed5]